MRSFAQAFRALALAGVMGVLPASAQQPAPAAPPAASAPPAAAVLATSTEAKVIVVGSVVQLRSGGPKMTVVELTAAVAGVQWYNESSGFKKEAFPVAALKLVDADEDDEDDEEEDE